MNSIIVTPARGPLEGTLLCPPDKSLSHRAALIGALGSGTSIIEGFSFCDDCLSTLGCLQALGAAVDSVPEEGRVKIRGTGLHNLQEPDTVLDVGNSGTTIRMLAGLACGIDGLTILTGDQSIRRRPMKRIIEPLARSGALLGGRENDRFPPLFVRGRSVLNPFSCQMEVASAQVKSALLFAALFANGESVIEERLPTRNHTENMLKALGVALEVQGRSITLLPPEDLPPAHFSLPGDPSSAAFSSALALLLPGSSITIRHVGLNPLRNGFFQALKTMGSRVNTVPTGTSFGEPVGEMTIQQSVLHGTSIARDMVPALVDEIPILAVLATQAEGVTVISGAGELRVKESDRLQGIARGLQMMGADITEQEDGLTITGPVPLRGASVQTCGDHRLAMSFVIAGLIAEGETRVDNASCIGVSYPGFFRDLSSLGISTVRREGE